MITSFVAQKLRSGDYSTQINCSPRLITVGFCFTFLFYSVIGRCWMHYYIYYTKIDNPNLM